MGILILYMTSHGCAEKAAKTLKEMLNDEVVLINLKRDSEPDLAAYDTMIIGGSIHAGRIQGRIKKFCERNASLLLDKKLGLFLCCMEEGEKAQKQFEDAFSAELRDHATAMGLFGGEFNFERMNFLEKKIVKKVAKVSESVFKINKKAIDKFASAF